MTSNPRSSNAVPPPFWDTKTKSFASIKSSKQYLISGSRTDLDHVIRKKKGPFNQNDSLGYFSTNLRSYKAYGKVGKMHKREFRPYAYKDRKCKQIYISDLDRVPLVLVEDQSPQNNKPQNLEIFRGGSRRQRSCRED